MRGGEEGRGWDEGGGEGNSGKGRPPQQYLVLPRCGKDKSGVTVWTAGSCGGLVLDRSERGQTAGLPACGAGLLPLPASQPPLRTKGLARHQARG